MFTYFSFSHAVGESGDGIVLILPALSEFSDASLQSFGDCLGLLGKLTILEGLHGFAKVSGLPAGTGRLGVSGVTSDRHSYTFPGHGLKVVSQGITHL